MDSSEAARALAKRRKRQEKTCEVCQKLFCGLSWSRFCGPTCRQLAWLREHREEWNEKRRARRARPAAGGEP